MEFIIVTCIIFVHDNCIIRIIISKFSNEKWEIVDQSVQKNGNTVLHYRRNLNVLSFAGTKSARPKKHQIQRDKVIGCCFEDLSHI